MTDPNDLFYVDVTTVTAAARKHVEQQAYLLTGGSGMSEFSWHCPVCGHLNTEPMEGARIERATALRSASSTSEERS